MPNSWGRPPRYDGWQDLQTLVVWVLVIGVVGYLLFPNFFQGVWSRLTAPMASQTSVSSDAGLPASGNSSTVVPPSLNSPDSSGSSGSTFLNNPNYPSVYSTLYNANSQVSSGYWVIYVADGKFQQFALTTESYTYLSHLIESDQKAVPKEQIILAANGQIRQYSVSEELYNIILNMGTIEARTNGP
ncbi:hypothetical protein CEB3_c24270 [Peptococcaceae bacterium CEB3]|nr:hypothetical protein CEB3_c24270 [Peptococcaceae bacterium CEB3]